MFSNLEGLNLGDNSLDVSLHCLPFTTIGEAGSFYVSRSEHRQELKSRDICLPYRMNHHTHYILKQTRINDDQP